MNMKHTLQKYFLNNHFLKSCSELKKQVFCISSPFGGWGALFLFFFITTTTFAQNKNEILLEDFKSYRPNFSYTFSPSNVEGTWLLRTLPALDSTARPRLDITQEINRIWDYVPIVETRKTGKQTVDGWRVQIYRGRSVEEAQKIRERSYGLFPNLTPYLEYRTPTYRVKSGDFLTENEAYPYWKRLKKIFPTALIVPDIVNVVVVDDDEDEEKK